MSSSSPGALAGASMAELGARAKVASRALALAGTDTKNAALVAAADLLVAREVDILAANGRDVARGEASGATPTQLDRLRLSAAKLRAMANGKSSSTDKPENDNKN